jgi:hypothetical protein
MSRNWTAPDRMVAKWITFVLLCLSLLYNMHRQAWHNWFFGEFVRLVSKG